MAEAKILDGVGRILDGVAMAAEIKGEAAKLAAAFAEKTGRAPGLAVVLVGENPASQVYVRSKLKLARELGFHSVEHRPAADIDRAGLLALIAQLNADPAVDGILVQLPLPPHLDADDAIAAISPEKDVDGFHVVNAGKLFAGLPGFVPCTPLGCLKLIKSVQPNLAGANAVVVGRSNIVGKPMAHLLLQENCTVTIAHSKTRDLPAVVAGADVLVAAVGRPSMIPGKWIKPGAIVVDVGINRVPALDGKTKLVGDVDFESAKHVAGAITPVPGGVGPMTVAYLMVNTCRAAYLRAGLDWGGV
ncbi:methenyltetrahydrofolate cyclohydrolase [Rhodomicrobium udaipurense JA643]|uniref:Bifunctional protein FolD n=1 Tax=Rhodomicrobium udaipurense TaxID=1202716 RepID=A0A8I1GAU5_9HYPH|nr:bifunctional methylenetetrahydrofolate dehydrogenase/methenyltetrahydrofolate cyclohydrolase FolD [Rhodomicrobium udaipurense]KAI93591.1 methenyltetrahydrofolate cyclohydrolase [Rhodomicrobium udaipurense JA643]MBJ7543677.1 bifunctional methylenetetrahydrofolate dehydrogenase/methenyltetrahydrofolate cyclohydrolase FolD [Rhodomicrobium udaipurense]